MAGRWDGEDRYDRVTRGGKRELGEVQGSCFSQTRNGLFNGLPLGGRTRFWIQGDVSAFFRGGEHSSEFHQFSPVGLIIASAVHEIQRRR